MESAYGIISQCETDVTGRADVSLKTTPAAGIYDFWGGALRVPCDCDLKMGKAVLHLEDGRVARILVDSMHDDCDGTRLVTFLGYTPLQPPRILSDGVPAFEPGKALV